MLHSHHFVHLATISCVIEFSQQKSYIVKKGCCVEDYIIAQVILAFWFVLAYNLLEDRCTMTSALNRYEKQEVVRKKPFLILENTLSDANVPVRFRAQQRAKYISLQLSADFIAAIRCPWYYVKLIRESPTLLSFKTRIEWPHVLTANVNFLNALFQLVTQVFDHDACLIYKRNLVKITWISFQKINENNKYKVCTQNICCWLKLETGDM